MIERLPIRAILVALTALFVWWLWPAEDNSVVDLQPAELVSEVADSRVSFASNVEPISLSSAAAEPVMPSSAAQTKFQQAQRAANSGNTNAAIRIYQEIIDGNSEIVEPYINLAALYAQSNQLNRAQQTLTRGLNANQNYATLFASLQQVLGALAANAYQEALEQEGEKIAALQLPSVATLASNSTQQAQLNLLQERIAHLQSETARATKTAQSAAEAREKLQLVENELASAKETIDSLRTEYSQRLATLQSQLSEQNVYTQNLLASNERIQADEKAQLATLRDEYLKAQQQQAALDANLEEERIARERLQAELLTQQQQAEQRELALQAELAKQKELAQQQEIAKQAEIEKAKKQVREEELAKQKELARQQEIANQAAIEKAKQQAREEELAKQRELARQQEIANQAAIAQQQEQQRRAVQQSLEGSQKQQAQAVELITSWAAAWSRQAVSDYVNHYANDYTPHGGDLTHQQWLEQRRVRLTNKAFIEVSVSNFEVRTTDAGFDVTFSQHYKSNTMDDVIRKRLSFATDSDDWSGAKIIAERVIR